MKKRYRLKSSKAFTSLLSGQRFYSTSALAVYYRPNSTKSPRIGVAVSKRIKKVVNRNKAKRLVREVARLEILPSLKDRKGDLLLLAKDVILEIKFEDLLLEAKRIGRQLQDRSEKTLTH